MFYELRIGKIKNWVLEMRVENNFASYYIIFNFKLLLVPQYNNKMKNFYTFQP